MANINIIGIGSTTANKRQAGRIGTSYYLQTPFEYWLRNKTFTFKPKIITGYTRMVINRETLVVTTSFDIATNSELNNNELKELVNFVQDEWENGHGKKQATIPIARVDGENVYINPYSEGQMVYVKQIS